jgi:uncharacterized protein YcfJ
MKKIIGLIVLFTACSVNAQGVSLKVISVDPVYKNVTRHQTVTETRKVCYRENQSSGLLERVVDGGFGSTEGLVGTGVGVAIGSEIGGGRGNDAAKIIGGLIGNKIGNNIANNKRNQCEYEDIQRQQPYTVQEISKYKITVEMEDSQFVVTRQYQPRVGDYIPVSLNVY